MSPTHAVRSDQPLRLDDLIPAARHHPPLRWLQRGIEKLLGIDALARRYARLPPCDSPAPFLRLALDALDVRYVVDHGSLERLPARGPLLVVANHPCGAVEGMLLAEMLLRRRPDVRVMANSLLKRIPELAGLFLGVNPYGGEAAVRQNLGPLREGLRWLRQGGALIVFPAGDVAGIHLRNRRIEDGDWDRSVARLAGRTGATVVPIHVEGRNSTAFYLAALAHPLIKTLLLPRELLNKRGRLLRLRIGTGISPKRLESVGDEARQIAFLRLRTHLLQGQDAAQVRVAPAAPEPLVEPREPARLAAELAALPAAQRLVENGEFEVWQATAGQIPELLQEIGRLREISFRAAGEGTGREIDLDLYDQHYRHLFVWNRVTREVVGGYRLGLVDEILPVYGRSGLYTYSLFRYSRAFLHGLPPAIELGRSFVRPEYQRSFAPLQLLWKGIGRFVVRHPRHAVLFGPVSISADYSPVSQQLLVEFLRRNRFDARLGRRIRPRQPYVRPRGVGGELLREIASIDELSALLSAIESDAKGVPVLIRQYLKLGGRMLGFNVDRQFSNVIDGLVRVDLRETDPRLLRKYMGDAGAETFLAAHAVMPARSA